MEDISQVARLAIWRATRSFNPSSGSSLKAYRTSAVRNAVYDEAKRFHSIFTLKRHDERAGLHNIRVVSDEIESSHDTILDVNDLISKVSHYLDVEKLPDLERYIFIHHFLGSVSPHQIASDCGISIASFYRAEKKLKKKIEREVLYA